ncbi:MAG: HlyD family efflux transporter periplasmic adaptor subunit [Oscillospiraceae bacterium]|nr:HlyD family efflux transporter periplasmic adaptor subunit [Oscillospiraceae bacterium]
MNNENKRRDIIKNIAIAFLTLMLILMFFSNTIMNYTLPEVSSQYAQHGTISEMIRGSGTLETGKSFDVIVGETRKISGVNFKAGDTVEKGDVLYTLEDQESKELDEARKSLKTMETDYSKALVNAGASPTYVSDMIGISAARQDLEDAEEELENYDSEDYLKKKYAADYYTIRTTDREIAELTKDIESKSGANAPAGGKYEYYTASELDSAIADTDAAMTALDADDYSLLPRNWYNDLTAAKQKVDKLGESDEKTKLEGKKTEIVSWINSLATDDMLDLPAEYYDRLLPYKEAYETAKDEYDKAKKKYDDYSAKIGTLTDYDHDIAAKQHEVDAKNLEIEENNEAIITASMSSSEAETDIDALYKKARTLQNDLKYLNEELNTLISKKMANSSQQYNLKTYSSKLEKAQEKLNDATEAYTKKKNEIKKELIQKLNSAKDDIADYSAKDTGSAPLNEAKKELSALKSSARTELRKTKEELTSQKTVLENKKKLEDKKAEREKEESDLAVKIETDRTTLRNSIKDKKKNLDTLDAAFSDKKITDGVKNEQDRLDLEAKAKDIEDQKALIKKLEEKNIGAVITAPVSGVIRSMTYTSGESTDAATAAAVIDMIDKGFILKLSVKNEQAKKLKIGSNAEVTNNYFGNGDTQAILSAIKADPSNPQTNRQLEFTITGSDLKSGDSISVQIGAKGQDYPVTLPNSAVRHDTNGYYVLAVESKSSPLGSRYFAQRYSVEVIVTNDVITAVNGLSGSEFVITTSSEPIKEGQQVKLSQES